MANMAAISVKKPQIATVFLPLSKTAALGKNTEMQTTIYDRIKGRIDDLGLSETGAAKQAGLSSDAIRNLRRRLEQGKDAGMSTRSLDKLAIVLQVSPAWLLTGRDSVPEIGAPPPPAKAPGMPAPNASFPPKYQSFATHSSIPILGQTVAGPNGRFILNGTEVGRVFTPPMLEGVEGAYAVRVYGTSMEPRYEAGETVWLNPHEPVRAGDDVVVQILTEIDHERESYIKKFVSQSAKVTRLLQHNPDEGESRELEFPSGKVFSVHKIVFHATT